MNRHVIYAVHDAGTIRVYQAYGDGIANQAVRLGTFGSSFELDRMTWIKPSFLWMMYRCGWATKEGQNRVLAIDMKREGFDTIVESSVLSSFSKDAHGTYEDWKEALARSDARCQWDPDRDIYGNPQQRRTIQLGIKGDLVRRYVSDWIVRIADVTQSVVDIRTAIQAGTFDESMLPVESEYTLNSPDTRG